MAIGGFNKLGTSRNNYLYGSQGEDSMDGGAGNDYLRGYQGNDELVGGTGSDRFVFERTLAQNGVDAIMDYTYAPVRGGGGGGDVDVLDFSLVGFARNALSRNSGQENGIDNVIRFVAQGGDALVLVALNGDGVSFVPWAVLKGLQVGDLVNFQVGAQNYTRPVQGDLAYDIGNGDRNGNGMEDDASDNDEAFDDALVAQGAAAEVLIGDRVRGFGGTTSFTPGETAIAAPFVAQTASSGTDQVADGAFEVYYGTYDAQQDVFTVTSTSSTTADPTSATHTMVLYDTDPAQGVRLAGRVLSGVYAESQWYLEDAGTAGATLRYDTDAFLPSEQSVLDAENVLYGTAAGESLDGSNGIDIIYGGVGNDMVFGGGYWFGSQNEPPQFQPQGFSPVDGNDWLYGGEDADTFFATDVPDGGIDVIKDFNATEGDVIALSTDSFAILSALENGSLNGSWVTLASLDTELGSPALVDIGALTDGSLEAALTTASSAGGVIDTEQGYVGDVYRLAYDGKDYLYWDAAGNGFNLGNTDDVIVEITGASGVAADDIYLWIAMG